MHDALAEHLVPDPMWRIVEDCLRPLQLTTPITRAAFATMLECVFRDLAWASVPACLQDSTWNLLDMFALCEQAQVWEALLIEAHVTKDRWTEQAARAAYQRAWRERAASPRRAVPLRPTRL